MRSRSVVVVVVVVASSSSSSSSSGSGASAGSAGAAVVVVFFSTGPSHTMLKNLLSLQQLIVSPFHSTASIKALSLCDECRKQYSMPSRSDCMHTFALLIASRTSGFLKRALAHTSCVSPPWQSRVWGHSAQSVAPPSTQACASESQPQPGLTPHSQGSTTLAHEPGSASHFRL